MKKYFQDLPMDCWHYRGRLGISEPFICLQGDSKAAEVLLRALDELAVQGANSRLTLTLKPSQHSQKCSKIRLILSPETEELKQMSLTRRGEEAIFEFTPFGLEKFRKAVLVWQNGGEDFCVSPDEVRNKKTELGRKDLQSGEVWFWTPFMSP